MNRKHLRIHLNVVVAAVAAAAAAWLLGVIDFNRPWWLLGLGALPLITWLAWRSRAGLPSRANAAAATLRGLLVILMVAALADLHAVSRSRRLAVYFLLDQSASIPPDVREQALSYMRTAVREKQPDDLAGLIVFAEDQSIETPLDPTFDIETITSKVTSDYTNLEAAVELAVTAFPAACRKKIVLVSDGNENTGEAMKAVRYALGEGVAVSVLPVQYTYRNEVMLDRIQVPDEARKGETFPVQVRVRSRQPATAALTLFCNDRVVAPARRVRLQPGLNTFSMDVRLERPGLHVYRAQVSSTADTMTANNEAVACVSIQGRARILLVGAGDSADAFRNLSAICRDLNLDTELATAPQFPVRLEALQAFDCIVLNNVPADRFSGHQLALIRSCVKDLGIGLVMIGGRRSFGAGGYGGTAVEEALPLRMEIKNRLVRRQTALVLAIDCSGSMSGEKLKQAKPAALAAVDALAPEDHVGIIAFDGRPRWLLRLQPARDRRRIRRAVMQLAAGGGTDIVAAVREGYLALSGFHVPIRHLIVLSDGQSSRAGLEPLITAIRQERITVSAVGIGERNGQPLMREIATRGGGRFHYVRNPRNLPQIFIRDVDLARRNPVVEEPFQPLLATSSELTANLSQREIPLLYGHVLATPKERALVSITSSSEAKDPVLAQWRYGLGKAVAFTADLSEWSRDWIEWNRYAALWGRILRWTRRDRQTDDLSLRVEQDGDRTVVAIDAIDRDGRFLDLSTLVGRRVDPDADGHVLDVRQSGVGRYQTAFRARRQGVHVLNFAYTNPLTGTRGVVHKGVVVPVSAEYRKLESNTALLRRIAHTADPRQRLLPADPAGAGIFASDQPPAITRRASWELLVVAALFVLFADIVVRRVLITRTDLKAAWEQAAQLLQHRDVEPDRTVGALLKRKGELHAGAGSSFRQRLQQDAADTASEIEVAEASDGGPAPDAPAPISGEPQPDGGAYTVRLLDAKRRAKPDDRPQ